MKSTCLSGIVSIMHDIKVADDAILSLDIDQSVIQ